MKLHQTHDLLKKAFSSLLMKVSLWVFFNHLGQMLFYIILPLCFCNEWFYASRSSKHTVCCSEVFSLWTWTCIRTMSLFHFVHSVTNIIPLHQRCPTTFWVIWLPQVCGVQLWSVTRFSNQSTCPELREGKKKKWFLGIKHITTTSAWMLNLYFCTIRSAHHVPDRMSQLL